MNDRERGLKENPTATETERASAGGFMAGLIMGVALGAGIALLFAPDSGRQTRRHLGRRLRDLQKQAARGLDRVETQARRELRRR